MTSPVDHQTGAIDYDLAIMLDAEDLAEQRLVEAYDELAPHLIALGVSPGPVTGSVDEQSGAYSVTFDGDTYRIVGDGIVDTHSWGLATFALFEIVNRQLGDVEQRLFALGGGNDLFAMFMTPAQAESARRAMPNHRRDWPYLPTTEPGWFGQLHN